MRQPFTVIVVVLCLAACRADEERLGNPGHALTAEEMSIEAPPDRISSVPDPIDELFGPEASAMPEPAPVAVDYADATELELRVVSETAYLNERRETVLDLLERDMAYVTLVVETSDGAPVRNAEATFELAGSSRVVPMSEHERSNAFGLLEFGVVGGKMNSETLKITVGQQSVDLRLNVISLEAAGYAGFDDTQGGLRWEQLMAARLKFDADGRASAEFPDAIAAMDGEPVRLIGFMMPLEPEQLQKHFLLTSNPPNCFFHVPGGPAGAVEVFAETGIAASWEPVLLEGRFETVQNNEMGVVYRLHQAREISQ